MADKFTVELKRRMAFAFDQWLKQARYPERLDQTELGRRVANAINRNEPYTQSAVAGWLLGKIPREPIAADALAIELGQEPGWLYFERGKEPVDWPAARAALVAQEQRAARKEAPPLNMAKGAVSTPRRRTPSKKRKEG